MVLLLLVGCGRPPTPEEVAEFDPYFQRFEAYSVQFGRATGGDTDVRIVFGELAPGVAGLCQQTTFQSPKVVVNRAVWNARSVASREALIFHELGHCLLGRDHRDEMKTEVRTSDGRERSIPASLMNLRGVPGTIYFENKEYYLRELFTGKG